MNTFWVVTHVGITANIFDMLIRLAFVVWDHAFQNYRFKYRYRKYEWCCIEYNLKNDMYDTFI